MSTTFPINNANVYSSGQWWDTPNPVSGNAAARLSRVGKGQGFQIDFVATGTDLTMSCYPYATAPVYTVSVDGGAATNITLPATGAWATASLFAALADAAHTVSIKHSTGNVDNLFLDYNGFLVLTGAAPSLSAPAGFGPVYNLTVNPYVAREGGWNYLTGGSWYNWPHLLQNNSSNAWTDVKVRFRATCTSLKIWCVNNSQKYRLWIDGVAQTTQVSAPSGGAYNWITMGTGLDGTAEHEYAISVDGGTSATDLLSVMAIGGTLNTTYLFGTPRGALVCIGDSIVQGVTGTSTNSAGSWVSRLAAAKNRQPVNLGINGNWLLSQPVSTAGVQDRLWEDMGEAAAGLGGASIDYVLLQIGHNDANNSAVAADFQQGYTWAIQRIAQLFPNATILCMGILPTSAATASANRTAFNTAISTAVTNSGIAKARYISTDGVISTASTGSTQDTFDGTHPTGGTLAGQTGDGSGKIVTLLSPSITTWAAIGPSIIAPTINRFYLNEEP